MQNTYIDELCWILKDYLLLFIFIFVYIYIYRMWAAMQKFIIRNSLFICTALGVFFIY